MASQARNVLLAKKWTDATDPTGWWMSEKLDGVRAYWSGSNFYSRQGNLFDAPDWFTKALPKSPLDGELWCGRGLFQKTLSIIKGQKHSTREEWKHVTYLVFDAPAHKGAYEERVLYLKNTIKASAKDSFAAAVGVRKCEGKSHLKQMLKKILMKKGEGIMLREPKSAYVNGRSGTLLKVKYFHDEECRVTGSSKGKGNCSGMMGKLHCELPNGVTFNVGTGFTTAMRKKGFKKGTIITFKYQELTNSGSPRFPVFVRVSDRTWEQVIANAKTKAPFSQIKQKPPCFKKQHSVLFSITPSRAASGEKIITPDDVDSDAEEEEGMEEVEQVEHAKSKAKPACQYGAKCYRTSLQHLAKFSHPEKEKEKAAEEAEESAVAASASADSGANMANDDDDDATTHHTSKKQKLAGGSAAHKMLKAKKKDDDDKDEKDERPPCIFGVDCYRTGEKHLKDFYHPKKGQSVNESQVDLADYFNVDPEDPGRSFQGKDHGEEGKWAGDWGLKSLSDDEGDDKKDGKKSPSKKRKKAGQ